MPHQRGQKGYGARLPCSVVAASSPSWHHNRKVEDGKSFGRYGFVRAAMRKAYGLEALPAPGKMEEIAAPWRPYCSVASWYLWRSLDGVAAL